MRREITVSAQLKEGDVVWTAAALSDGDKIYVTSKDSDTALGAVTLLAHELFNRVFDLEASLLEHYGA